MILASTDSTGYKIVLILHILFVVVAFGGMFAAPILARVEGASQSAATGMVGYLKRIAIPSVIIAGILGMGLIGMSKDGDVEVYKFSQTLGQHRPAAVAGRDRRATSSASCPPREGGRR